MGFAAAWRADQQNGRQTEIGQGLTQQVTMRQPHPLDHRPQPRALLEQLRVESVDGVQRCRADKSFRLLEAGSDPCWDSSLGLTCGSVPAGPRHCQAAVPTMQDRFSRPWPSAEYRKCQCRTDPVPHLGRRYDRANRGCWPGNRSTPDRSAQRGRSTCSGPSPAIHRRLSSDMIMARLRRITCRGGGSASRRRSAMTRCTRQCCAR